MPAMCEGCKGSIPLSDSYCSSCKQEGQGKTNRLAEREAQALAIAGKDREEVEEENPIRYAETGPCRYQSITYWFPDGDCVVVEENLDWEEEEVAVYFEDGSERVELKEGALYDWAVEQYHNA